MLLLIITFIVAAKAEELSSVIKTAIILPLAVSLLLSVTLGPERLAGLLMIPVHLVVGVGAFYYFDGKRQRHLEIASASSEANVLPPYN